MHDEVGGENLMKIYLKWSTWASTSSDDNDQMNNE